jgi:hypothetical protein
VSVVVVLVRAGCVIVVASENDPYLLDLAPCRAQVRAPILGWISARS